MDDNSKGGNGEWSRICIFNHSPFPKHLLQLMKVSWSTKVNKLAHVTLRNRHFDNRRRLPHPNDIELIAKYTIVRRKGKYEH